MAVDFNTRIVPSPGRREVSSDEELLELFTKRLKDPAELAHDMLLAAADSEFLRRILQHDHPMALALCIGGALKPADGVFRNEAVAVDAHKPSGEFVLKARERFFEQVSRSAVRTVTYFNSAFRKTTSGSGMR